MMSFVWAQSFPDKVSWKIYIPISCWLIFSFVAAKALTKKSNRPGAEEDSDREQDENDKENLNTSGQPNDPDQPKKKKVKKRKNISTITKNPESLNGRLDTNPLTDPFFAKLNSVIGDTNSSKRLMQNIIPTESSKLKLRQNMPFWSSADQTAKNLDEDFNFIEKDNKILTYNVPRKFRKLLNVTKAHVRIGLSSYRLTNEPIERYDDTDVSRYGDNMDNTVIHNSIHMEMQFDINAEVEPVMLEKSIMMDFGDMDNGDFEDMNEQDLNAVHRCKGLRRVPVLIEDMQPETCANLEYSYRPLEMIDQFWAGPSHWKFRNSRRTAMSMGTRASHVTNSTQICGVIGQKNTVRKRKVVKNSGPVLMGDIYNTDENMQNVVVKITSRMKGTMLSVQTISKKWDTKKHKLPQDYKIPIETFEKFLNKSTIQINSNPDITFTGNDDDGAGYDYDNETDRNYCSRLENQSDTETETNTDMGQMDNIEFDNLEMPPPSAPGQIDEIPDVFVGAPERIEKISIAFARRAKVVDMKQLKSCSWALISNKHNADPVHNPKFSETLKDLPKVLSRTMAENMSMPLAFYAVLHLCNDKSLVLNQNDEKLRDFEIQFLHDSSGTN